MAQKARWLFRRERNCFANQSSLAFCWAGSCLSRNQAWTDTNDCTQIYLSLAFTTARAHSSISAHFYLGSYPLITYISLSPSLPPSLPPSLIPPRAETQKSISLSGSFLDQNLAQLNPVLFWLFTLSWHQQQQQQMPIIDRRIVQNGNNLFKSCSV